MITIIFGAPGVGKSALMTYKIKEIYLTQGRKLLRGSRSGIEELNKTRGFDLTPPEKVPIFADFAVKFQTGYKKYYEPYFVNGYYIGLDNEKMDVMHFPPGSKIFLSEVQRYYNSRSSRTFPDWVSREFEMHRHYDLDFFFDTQRPMLVDLNIRALCKKFIEVQGMENETDFAGNILSSKFHCREFENNTAVEEYLKGGKVGYKETVYENRGNIFRCFNSFNYFDEFLPGQGKDFDYLPQEKQAGNAYYNRSEPKEYRGGK